MIWEILAADLMSFSLFVFIAVLYSSESKLIFTGNDVADQIILTSNLTVLISPGNPSSTQIIQELERNHIEYNVVQTSILV